VLDLFRGVGIAGLCTEALHPGVGNAVQEDDEALDELGGMITVSVRRPIPCPTQRRERSQESRKRHQTVAPENAALCCRCRLERIGTSGER
jgi:hypothetical protein